MPFQVASDHLSTEWRASDKDTVLMAPHPLLGARVMPSAMDVLSVAQIVHYVGPLTLPAADCTHPAAAVVASVAAAEYD